MKKNSLSIIFLFICNVFCSVWAQTPEDSITVCNIRWKIQKGGKGIVHKQAQVPHLYGGTQNINIIEIDGRKKKIKYGIAAENPNKKLSKIAIEHKAEAAINGSYFNMLEGQSVCYLRLNGNVIDTTYSSEFNGRTNGIVLIDKQKIEIEAWNKSKEIAGTEFPTALASGPLMIKDGNICDFSTVSQSFINTKHPRSAICITRDKKILLVTVDGRHEGNAIGINIRELAHLVKLLGAYDALNLDGGGSTSLWLKQAEENGIVNCPSDNRTFDHRGERRIANAIYIYK